MVTTLIVIPLIASGLIQKPVDHTRDLDFWVGEWECVFESRDAQGSWVKSPCRNSIRKEFGGGMISEHFTMGSYRGMSVNAYDRKLLKWRQTWVDGGSNYVLLEGGKEGDRFVFRTPKGQEPESRITYFDIQKDQMEWMTERKGKDGAWTTVLKMHYKRAKT
ncbi:MAG: hypothetical protein H7Y17_01755 [Chlorobia bacterium]|nr:hypothetical protein [Fimbriimonadaceae bacterium]